MKEWQSQFLENMFLGQASTKRTNLNPKSWGPPAWTFIDKIVRGFPERASAQDSSAMLDFLMSLGKLLPCEKCRKNFNRYMLENPPINAVASRRGVRKWLQAYRKKSS